MLHQKLVVNLSPNRNMNIAYVPFVRGQWCDQIYNSESIKKLTIPSESVRYWLIRLSDKTSDHNPERFHILELMAVHVHHLGGSSKEFFQFGQKRSAGGTMTFFVLVNNMHALVASVQHIVRPTSIPLHVA